MSGTAVQFYADEIDISGLCAFTALTALSAAARLKMQIQPKVLTTPNCVTIKF